MYHKVEFYYPYDICTVLDYPLRAILEFASALWRCSALAAEPLCRPRTSQTFMFQRKRDFDDGVKERDRGCRTSKTAFYLTVTSNSSLE